MLLLSGNEDGYVPSRGTRAWLESLGRLQLLDPKAPLHTWQDRSTGQVGGYVTTYRARMAGAGELEVPGQAASAKPDGTYARLGERTKEDRGQGEEARDSTTSRAAAAAEAQMWLGRKVELKHMHSVAQPHATQHARDSASGQGEREQAGQGTGQAAVEELVEGVDAATRVSGQAKEAAGQLDFVVVLNAGHAVPAFQPSATLQLLQAYLSGDPLQ